MIINDERFAASILVEGARGAEPRLFDDIGDLIVYEARNPDLRVLARYVKDHSSTEWLAAESAVFLRSPSLHTPMASGIAAYATRESAEGQRAKTAGEILAFDRLR
jgi:copper chaperone NosL